MVDAIRSEPQGWMVSIDSGETLAALRLVLAIGVADELPGIPGMAERWGKSVFHCPYCHGYELDSGRIGVVATGPMAFHQAMLLPDWGSVTLFTNGAYDPDTLELTRLRDRQVVLETTTIEQLVGAAGVKLLDGRVIDLDGLFTMSRTRPATDLASSLGCALEEGPLGQFIATGATRETSVPGVFACGDAARAAGSVALAVGDGTMAGVATHQSLVFR
jgi:thioredoxin reductase